MRSLRFEISWASDRRHVASHVFPMITTFAVSAVAAFAIMWPHQSAYCGEPIRRPNIVLILADDRGEQKPHNGPNLDKTQRFAAVFRLHAVRETSVNRLRFRRINYTLLHDSHPTTSRT